MRRIVVVLTAAVLFSVCLPERAFPEPADDVTVTPPAIGQGEVGLVTVKAKALEPEVTWLKKKVTLALSNRDNLWTGFFGADLTTPPGRYKLKIRSSDGGDPQYITVTVLSKDHGTRRITVPRDMVELDSETLARVRKEIEVVKGLFTRSAENPLWWGRWTRPVPGNVISPFGCRNIVNDMERSPHSGIDLKAPAGTPVKVTNRGDVVLTANHFFSGKSIIIDHGGGIHSMYFHLSRISIKAGEMVKKGDLIGLTGSSGRVTGPHLHFGIRLDGRRINPLKLIEVSEGLERP
ncbi:MAG: M23 family metallopeptidase [Deltaproteobacteria bacterium]|nr:MAG: M23 family metallopeptidase [Deltaproteobacteria bacterium]